MRILNILSILSLFPVLYLTFITIQALSEAKIKIGAIIKTLQFPLSPTVILTNPNEGKQLPPIISNESSCFETFMGYAFKSVPEELEEELTLEECQCLCANSKMKYNFQCLSALYSHEEKYCIFFTDNRQMKPEAFGILDEFLDKVTYIGITCPINKAIETVVNPNYNYGCIKPKPLITAPMAEPAPITTTTTTQDPNKFTIEEIMAKVKVSQNIIEINHQKICNYKSLSHTFFESINYMKQFETKNLEECIDACNIQKESQSCQSINFVKMAALDGDIFLCMLYNDTAFNYDNIESKNMHAFDYSMYLYDIECKYY